MAPIADKREVNNSKPSPVKRTNTQENSNHTTEKTDHQSARPKQSSPIYGNRQSSSAIAGKSRPFSLFVGGLNLALKTEDIRDIIEYDIGLKIVDLQLNRTNSYNKSYRVDIDPIDKQKSLDSNLWFKGLVVKPFRQQRNKSMTSYNTQSQQHNHQNHMNDNHINDNHMNDNHMNDNHMNDNSSTQYNHRNNYEKNNNTNYYRNNDRFEW